MREILDSLLQGGSPTLALWTGLFGTGLLLLIGLARRLRADRAARGESARREAPRLDTGGQRRQAKSAYAAHSAGAGPLPPKDDAGPSSYNSGTMPASPACPAELSRRIDRLEAKVQARRAGSHG